MSQLSVVDAVKFPEARLEKPFFDGLAAFSVVVVAAKINI
jgi:hypothetical protein